MVFQKSSPLKPFGICSLRLSLFSVNFCRFVGNSYPHIVQLIHFSKSWYMQFHFLGEYSKLDWVKTTGSRVKINAI